MIYLIKDGNIFESKCQTIVNAINCIGIMGKGIALKFKQEYPEMYNDYKQKCYKKQVKLGVPYLYKVNDNKFILNFPTKYHWKDNSNLNDIENGIKYMIDNKEEFNFQSISIPALGCGLGSLKFDDVKDILMKLKVLDIPIEIYYPK